MRCFCAEGNGLPTAFDLFLMILTFVFIRKYSACDMTMMGDKS